MKFNFAPLVVKAGQLLERNNNQDAFMLLRNALEKYPYAAGAADAMHMIDVIHMRLLNGHFTEISCLVAYRLRATLIDSGLEFDILVNLVRACLNQKSFEEAYQYGIIAEKINNSDPDLLANMIAACVFCHKDNEASERTNQLRKISIENLTELESLLKGESHFKPTYHLSCDDLVPKFENLKNSLNLSRFKEYLSEFLEKPDGQNSWKCWRTICEIHISLMSRNEFLNLQEYAGIAAAAGKVIAFHPNHAINDYHLWKWRGMALGQLCFYSMAIQALKTACNINSMDVELNNALNYCQEMESLSINDPRRPDSKGWLRNHQ